jgi:hypothetical protein
MPRGGAGPSAAWLLSDHLRIGSRQFDMEDLRETEDCPEVEWVAPGVLDSLEVWPQSSELSRTTALRGRALRSSPDA